MNILRSATRQAIATLHQRRESLVGPGASTEQLVALASELYSVAGLLNAQSRLRRTLGDGATSADSRAELASTVLNGKVDTLTLSVVQAAVRLRWSSPWDLADALEASADDALFAAAEAQGVLPTVEDELFRFERILQDAGELAAIFDDHKADAQRRIALLERVVSGKVNPITAELLRHAVTSERKHSILLAIDDLVVNAGRREDYSLARVNTAVELSEEQTARLAAALTELYGHPIGIRSVVDPTVLGGLVIRVGDEIIDGSVASRLLQARTALTG